MYSKDGIGAGSGCLQCTLLSFNVTHIQRKPDHVELMRSKTKGTTLVSDLSDVLSLQPDVDPGSLVPLDGEAEGRVDVDEPAHLPHAERRPGVRLDRLATHQLQLVEGGSGRHAHCHLDHLGARDAARAARHVLCRDLIKTSKGCNPVKHTNINGSRSLKT